jgi:TolA-binding protein
MGSARLVLAACLAALAAAPALAGDIVINAKGAPLGNPKASGAVPPNAADYAGSEWEIVDDNLDGVTYQIPGVATPQSIPRANVREVFHDPANVPPELSKGTALLDRDDFDGARAAFGKVEKDPSLPPWARAQAAFMVARSYMAQSDAQNAEKEFAAFKSAFPKSVWVTSATEGRARALMALDKIEEAKAEFASLRKLPGVTEDVAVEADYWLVWIDEQVAASKTPPDQAGLQAAQKGYESLMTKLQGKTQLDALYRRAQVGRASVLIALGKPADAKTELEKIIKDTKDPRALAGLYNKLGSATWRAAPSDKNEMKQALMHYLRVVTLYGDAEGTDEDCAEAMFHAGTLFKELKDQGPDWNLRARREWNDVVARFPGSPWARKAKSALNER